MKKLTLLLISVSLVGCITETDDYCECSPPPGTDEQLRISLVNDLNENLLSETTNGYIPDSLFTFYLLTNNKVLNLSELQTNSSFIMDFGTNNFSKKEIVLAYSWYLESNNTKEGSYVIDYNNIYPNDTIFVKYQITEWQDSDTILQVKLNGVPQQIDSLDFMYRKLVIVK